LTLLFQAHCKVEQYGNGFAHPVYSFFSYKFQKFSNLGTLSQAGHDILLSDFYCRKFEPEKYSVACYFATPPGLNLQEKGSTTPTTIMSI